MPHYTRRELVLLAFSRGKEQSAACEFARTATVAYARYGTVAVLPRDGQYWVVVHELHLPTKKDWEFDVDEHHILPNLAAVEALLAARFQLRLEDLGPSRGSRVFHNNTWPPQDLPE